MFHAWMTQTWAKCGSSFVIQSASCAISKNLSSSCKSLARIQSTLTIKPAEAAQRHGRERQHRRRVFQRLHARQAQPVAVAIQSLLHRADTRQQHRGQQQQKDLFQTACIF